MFTHTRTEQILCASVLTDPHGKLGPNLCTALAYAPGSWDSPEAAKVAEGIGVCIRKGHAPKPESVALCLAPEYKHWLKHPSFKEGLPLGLADFEAQGLLKHYWNKRLINTVAKAYEQMITNPEKARDIGITLKQQLEDYV